MQLKQKGLGIAVISYDSVAVLENFSKRKSITIPLLSDPDSKVIRAFGILNEDIPKDSFSWGIPHPVTFIVNEKGVLASKVFEDDYRQRPTVANILTQQFNLRTGAAETVVDTKHLRVTASSSNAVIRGGEHIRLIVDIAPKSKMHVYAPGVEGYIPIEWKLTDSPGWQANAVQYPPSKKLRLEAIQETVLVYDSPFTLQRELTIAPVKSLQPLLDANGDVTVEGALRYQACDDRICYIPQSIPLHWKLHFAPHDPTRVPPELQRRAPKQ